MLHKVFKPFVSITSTNFDLSKFLFGLWSKYLYTPPNNVSIFTTMNIFEKVRATRLVLWAMQCTRIQKGECLFFNWVATPVLMPWKVVAPSAPKHTTLVTKSWSNSPPKPFTKFRIMFVKLSIMSPSMIHSKFTKINVILKSSTT